ncbi:hypothetical protein, partial [Escherichia coli]|uniref:hypothetical protein n=1 Tax=Escherichia coli TaxID=562 RepID=UPI0021CED0CB
MYNLTIIREPNEYDGNTTYGEVLVFQSTEQSGIEHKLKDYLRDHLYLHRTDANCNYGDIMFIVTHNGAVIEHMNMTNVMDFYNYTDTSIPLDNYFSTVFDALRRNVAKNDRFCTNFRFLETNTRKNLSK